MQRIWPYSTFKYPCNNQVHLFEQLQHSFHWQCGLYQTGNCKSILLAQQTHAMSCIIISTWTSPSAIGIWVSHPSCDIVYIPSWFVQAPGILCQRSNPKMAIWLFSSSRFWCSFVRIRIGLGKILLFCPHSRYDTPHCLSYLIIMLMFSSATLTFRLKHLYVLNIDQYRVSHV